MYRYADPILDASAYYNDMDEQMERFEAWERSNCKCKCGNDAEYRIDGNLYCEDCALEEFLIDGDKDEFSIDGERISGDNFYSVYHYGDDERWSDYLEIA